MTRSSPSFKYSLLLWFLSFGLSPVAQNYTDYHKSCLNAYEHCIAGEFSIAIDIFTSLEDDYTLFPNDEYTFGLAFAVVGELDSARVRILNSAANGAFSRWLDKDRWRLVQNADARWYEQLKSDFLVANSTLYIADFLRIEVEWGAIHLLNQEYQDAMRDPGLVELSPVYEGGQDLSKEQRRLRTVLDLHAYVFSDMMDDPVPFGIRSTYLSGSFSLFCIHTPPEVVAAHIDTLKQWMEDGHILPREFAEALDMVAQNAGEPMRFGLGQGDLVRPDDYLENRREIGIGNEQVENLRMHW